MRVWIALNSFNLQNIFSFTADIIKNISMSGLLKWKKKKKKNIDSIFL